MSDQNRHEGGIPYPGTKVHNLTAGAPCKKGARILVQKFTISMLERPVNRVLRHSRGVLDRLKGDAARGQLAERRTRDFILGSVQNAATPTRTF